MRFSVIKYEEEETLYYNPRTFYRDEDVIIFPFKEFDSFYNELVHNLDVVKNITGTCLDSESISNPTENLRHSNDWINLIKDEVDLLLKFRIQTTLNSFQKGNSVKIKPPEKPKMADKLELHSQIQCLIGL